VQAVLVIDDNNCVPFAEFIPLPHFGGNDDPSRRIELCVVSTRFLPFHNLRAVLKQWASNSTLPDHHDVGKNYLKPRMPASLPAARHRDK